MLKFIEHEDDTVVNITDESGDSVGDLIMNNSRYGLSLNYVINNPDYLRQIADKLDELGEL